MPEIRRKRFDLYWLNQFKENGSVIALKILGVVLAIYVVILAVNFVGELRMQMR